MAEYNIGSSGSGYEDTIRRMQQASQAADELRRKEEERATVEEQVAGTEEGSARIRTSLARATQELSSSLSGNTTVLGLESSAIRANTAALEANLAVRRSLATVGPYAAAEGVVATGGGSGSGRRPPVVAAAGGYQEDPNAAGRVSAAQRALAEAELARAQAQAAVVAGRRQPGATSEVLAPLVERRELAVQQVTAARQELRAAQQNAERSQQAAELRAQENVEQRQINAALARQRLALEAQATLVSQQRVAAASTSVYEAGTGPGGLAAGSLAGGAPRYRQFPIAPPTFGYATGGPTESAAPQAATEHLAAYREVAAANTTALEGLTERQLVANQAFAEAGATYADASTRLSRHGALTTEFIQALAQGQVTLGEFSSQMVSTIGKFSGWAVAGAAVYGVYGAFRDLLHGATETQAAIAQLGRFIPGLGGPEGGGTGQVGAAASLVRNISTQFNVPISEVTDAMMIVARTFHDLRDAGEATRAVLAVTRLDQVPPTQAEQYLVGIAQSGVLSPTRATTGGDLVKFVNQLNALQVLLGARVAQTLPAISRAAPAATAAGLDINTLESLVALGVRSGQTGNQVGTAIIRGLTRFAYLPGSETTFHEYGINPQIGQAGDLVRQVFDTIDRRAKAGTLRGLDVLALSSALGGPQLGARTFAPILEQEALQPGLFSRALDTTQHPRSYQEDLNQVLSTVSERFRAIGIALQAFGSQLYQAGLLTPITGVLDAFVVLTHVIERLASPVTDLLGAFNQLPGVVRDAIGVFVAFRAASYLGSTRLGGTAQAFLGRLPGAEDLATAAGQQNAVQGTATRLSRELIPRQRGDYESASLANLRAQRQYLAAETGVGQFVAANADVAALPLEDTRRQQYEAELQSRRRTAATAANRAATADEAYQLQARQLADMEAQLVVLKDNNLTFAQRAVLLEQQGMVASGEIVNLKEQMIAAYREQLGTARGGVGSLAGGAGSLAGSSEAAVAGGVGAAAVVGARAVSRDTAAMRDLTAAAAVASRSGAAAEATAAERGHLPIFTPVPTGALTAEERATAAGRYIATPQERFAQAYGGVEGARYAGPELAAEGSAGRFAEYAASLRSQAAGLAGFATGPGAPLAALLGTQVVGSSIGGGIGNYIANVGGTAATGALIAQMLGRSTLVGAALGGTLGNVQQGGTGSLLGGLLGAGVGGAGVAIGGALGILGGPFAELTVPAGAAIGGFIGSSVGGLFGGSSPPSPQDVAAEANKRVQRLFTSGGNRAAQDFAFTSQFQQDLSDSVYASGTSQQRGQASIQSIIANLTAQQQLFGPAGPAGRGIATRQLGLVISAAVQTAAENPVAAAQVIQSAVQARNQPIQQQFAYSLAQATTPQQAQRAAGTAQQALQQIQTGGFDQAVKDATVYYDSAWNFLQQALQTGSQHVIDNARKILGDASNQLTAARNAAGYARQASAAAQQAVAQQALAAAQQDDATLAQLQAARAGGNQLSQLQAAHRQGQADLQAAQTTPGLSPRERQQAIRQADAQLSQNQTQRVQYGYQQVQAQAALLQSTAAVGDPVSAARLAVQGTQQELAYMQAHARAFDPTQLQQLQAQLNSEQTALTQSVADQAVQLTNLAGQIAAAREYGDPLAQARSIAAAAQQAVGQAVGPVAHQSAVLAALTAQNAVQDQVFQRVQLQGQLAASLALGDPVRTAQAAQQTAQNERAAAVGYEQQTRAQVDLNNANYQYASALAQQATQIGQLRASLTPEPLQQLAAEMAATVRALATPGLGVSDRRALQTQLNQYKIQAAQTLLSQRETTIQFQFDMMQITTGQAIAQLRDLLKLKDITKAQRDQILEQIRRFQLGLEQPLGGSGQFDLAPGTIRMPTFYDVARALGHGNQRGTGPLQAHMNAINASATYNYYFNVRNKSDASHIADALDRSTGGHLRQRLRAAGVR